MSSTVSSSRPPPPVAQAVTAPPTQAATFLVLSVLPGDAAARTARAALAGVAALVKNVGFRDAAGSLACTVGIGSDAWPRLAGGAPPPAELHAFRPVAGARHAAPATPGDVLVHIRADRRDLCFELERQLMRCLGGAVRVDDRTDGFRYFDQRDLLGFVDGTANPVGPALPEAVLVDAADVAGAGAGAGAGTGAGTGAETGAGTADAEAAAAAAAAAVAGSYVVVQKYLHDLAAWEKLPAEAQEAIVGRTKLDNVELGDAAAGAQKSHKTLATVEDDAGAEHDILRDNMPFGSPGAGQFGTYFIGYSRRLWVVERMLQRMFVGDPPGLHDRILDFSTPVTGGVFFVPSASFLAGIDGGDD